MPQIKAVELYNLNLGQSWMIGDSWRDIKAGEAAGCKTIYINEYKDKKSEESLIENEAYPNFTANSLLDAVSDILKL